MREDKVIKIAGVVGYKVVAEICRDDETGDVIVNWPQDISLEELFKIMDKAIISLVKYREQKDTG